jgi:methyl-accepting chemotaxis protein
VTNKFDRFAETISEKTNTAVEQLDGSIDDLRDSMKQMQFDNGEIHEMEEAAEKAATAGQDLENSMHNIGGAADENVQGTFKMSVALTEFASTAMSVSGLITSIKSSIEVFNDEGATGFEKVGAALSILMPLMSSYNSL